MRSTPPGTPIGTPIDQLPGGKNDMTPQGVSRALRARNVNVQSGKYATIMCKKGGPTGVSVWIDDSRLVSSQVERSRAAVEAALNAAGYDHYRSECGAIIFVQERL